MIIKKRNQKIVASLMAAIVLASCSSKLKTKVYAEPQHVFATDKKDEKLEVRATKADELLKKISANQEMKTGELFRSIGGLYTLANQFDKPSLKTLAHGIDGQFYSSINTTAKIRFEESPIIQAILGKGKTYIEAAPIVLNIFDGKEAKYPWPQNVKLSDFGTESANYGTWVIGQLKTAKVDESVANMLKDVFDKILADRQSNIDDSVSSITASATATDKMSNLTDLLDTLQLDLENQKLSSLKSFIASATAIASKIDAIADQATAAAALTDAKKLFSAAEIATLKSDAKPDELKKALTDLLQSSTLAKIETTASAVSLPDLPNQILSFIATEIGTDITRIRALASNPEAEIKKLASQFAQAQLASAPAGINGVESDKVSIIIQANTLRVAGGPTKDIKTSAEALGSSISNSIAEVREQDKLLKDDAKSSPEANSSIMSQLNKLVLLCGYPTADNKIASYTTAQDDKSTPVILLDDGNQPKQVAAVSDEVSIAKNLTPTATAKSVSVRGQATLLRGISDLISYLRDWEQNGYEKGIGQITTAQFFGITGSSTIQAINDQLAKPLFDKGLMFAFAVKNAGAILANAKKELSPFYLMGPNEAPVWVNELPLKDENGNEIKDSRATAGVVDIENGQRSSVTKVGDISRYMIAIATFLKATDGVDQTKSSLLLAVDQKTGETNLQKLLEARGTLRTLLAALANMLSHNIQQTDGSFAAQFSKDDLKASGHANAVDSALAIEALTKAGSTLEAEAYNTSAIEGYFALNKSFWSNDLQFYAQDETKTHSPSYDELVSILTSINELAPHMPEESQKQWEQIATNWVGALELLSKNVESANH